MVCLFVVVVVVVCVWDTKLLFFEGSLDFITLSLYNFLITYYFYFIKR